MKSAKRWAIHGAVLALAASLTACGGGGGSSGFGALGTGSSTGTNTGSNPDGNGAQTSTKITGVAAVGAPLVGTVTVKDKLGATRTAPIGTNGSYSIDVTGMTAPFVFRAEGTANGVRAVVYSIATEADLNGRINVTQLTDLIVSNIAGQLAQNYFDNFAQSGNSDLADKALIDAEVAKLKEKLLPVLTALGVDAAIDLLHSSFTPLSDPLDKALDVIRVSYDTAANTATISNLLNTVTVVDQLAVKAAAEPSPATLSDANVAAGVTDQELVRQVLKDFTAKFANGSPTSADLTPLMTNGFLWSDKDRPTSLAEFTQNTALVGATFTDIEFNRIDYANPNGVTAHLSFSVKTSNGVELGRLDNWKVRKSLTDGLWRLHGDQRSLDLEWFAVTSQHHTATGGTCVNTGLEFNIENPNTANDGGTIAYIIVQGPGLPANGLRYSAPQLGGRWMIDGIGTETEAFVDGTDEHLAGGVLSEAGACRQMHDQAESGESARIDGPRPALVDDERIGARLCEHGRGLVGMICAAERADGDRVVDRHDQRAPGWRREQACHAKGFAGQNFPSFPTAVVHAGTPIVMADHVGGGGPPPVIKMRLAYPLCCDQAECEISDRCLPDAHRRRPPTAGARRARSRRSRGARTPAASDDPLREPRHPPRARGERGRGCHRRQAGHPTPWRNLL